MSFILDLIFPPRCLACRTFCRQSLCPECTSRFPFLNPPYCPRCALPFEGEGENHLCATCLEAPPPFYPAAVIGTYQGLLLELIGRMKYKGEERIATFLGAWLGGRLQALGTEVDRVVPVPLHSRRLRSRGFNQAVVMARRIAKILNKPMDPLMLRRNRETPPQTGLTAVERGKNLSGAFEVRRNQGIKGSRLLLVDDVYTTGATLSACAALLKKSGAAEIKICVAARTP